MCGRVKKIFFLDSMFDYGGWSLNEWNVPSIGKKPSAFGFNQKCVGGAKIEKRYRLLSVRFTLWKVFWAIILFAVRLFLSFLSVFRTIPVTCDLRNSDHCVAQLFSYTLKQLFAKNILCFPAIHAQRRSFTKFKIVLLDVRAEKKIALLDEICPFFGKLSYWT